MSIFRVIWQELAFRRLNFWLAVFSVAAATGCIVGAFALLARHDQRTAQLVAEKEAATTARTKKLEDDYRKITRELGFNLLILPAAQNLAELHANDYATETMPEQYAEKLAKSRVATINHILPSLQRKVIWPEQERTVIVVGTRGELAMAVGNEKKPLLEDVPPGSVVLGSALHKALKLNVGDKTHILGRAFTVSKVHSERGTKDDITLWIPLAEAQALFHEEGRINAILALECNCADGRLAEIRRDIAAVLPDTQVVELAAQADARAGARNRAAQETRDAGKQEAAQREALRKGREEFAAILTPLVVFAALLAVTMLTITNVRERRVEIGTLRAIGWRSAQVLQLFLVKSLLIGVVGAGLGCVAGTVIGSLLGEPVAGERWPVWQPAVWAIVLITAPLITVVASWLPALFAARQDPAVVLSQG